MSLLSSVDSLRPTLKTFIKHFSMNLYCRQCVNYAATQKLAQNQSFLQTPLYLKNEILSTTRELSPYSEGSLVQPFAFQTCLKTLQKVEKIKLIFLFC